MTTTTSTDSTGWETLRKAVLPGGYGRISLAVGGTPPLVRSAQGPWLETRDGRRLIDTNNNMSVNLHGNAHPHVVDVVRARIDEGLISIGIANTDELELAAALVGRTAWAEQVRFANSGSEAVTLAARVARARTGRDKVLITAPGYHGTADVVLPAMGARGVRGVPGPVVEQTVTVPRDDTAALVRAIEEHGHELAAVVIDLAANRAGMTSLSQEFVDTADRLSRQAGALLVVDEVVTFRNAYAGLVSTYGVEPDLTVLGKTIGGGFPIGAVMGTKDALSPLDPEGYALEHGGTFTGNPLSMAAGVATLELFDPPAVERLNALGARLEAAVGDDLAGTGWELRRSGSVFRMWPAGWDAADRGTAQNALFRSEFEHGVLGSGSGLSTLSTVMTEEIVDDTARGLVLAAREVRP